jgi:hypothetical protein
MRQLLPVYGLCKKKSNQIAVGLEMESIEMIASPDFFINISPVQLRKCNDLQNDGHLFFAGLLAL